MSKRQSITAAFSALHKQPQAEATSDTLAPPAVVEPATRAARVPAGIIGATSRTMTEIRQERDELAEKLAKAGGAREIDAELLDPSPFPDRLTDADDVDFETLKRLIEEEGQKVAIQVREHPKTPGRYQIIYGHRRWRAAKALGRPVRAEIVEATDEQLAVAQGIENSARQDLTWIERALFAWRLEKSGIKANGIRAALAVDDAQLSNFRAVCRALPSSVIERIGRAPRIGRPRWLELVTKIGSTENAVERIRKTLSADKVSELPSDERFRLALAAMQEAKATRTPDAVDLKGPNGKAVGRLVVSRDGVKISFDKQHATALSGFLQAEMPGLIARYFASEGAEQK